MAEGDATVYNNYKELLLNGDVDLVNDTLNMILLGSGYTLDATGNPGYSDVSANEIGATGYTAGGKALTGKAVTQNDTANVGEFDAADVAWTSLATTTINHAVLYDDTITAPVADPLLIHWEIATNSNGNDYTLQFAATGVLRIS